MKTGIRKLSEFVNQIEKLENLIKVRELRRFLEMINFQQKFIRNCLEVAAPLSVFTSGNE